MLCVSDVLCVCEDVTEKVALSLEVEVPERERLSVCDKLDVRVSEIEYDELAVMDELNV